MVDLRAKSPCEGILPISIGACRLSEVTPAHLTLIAPHNGQEKPLSDALKAAHGMALPAAGRATGKDGARCVWFGQGQVMLIGPAAKRGLAKHAALVDQSDGWAMVRLEGATATDVLARLVPLDLRESVFKRGQTARSQLLHMMVSITRVGARSFDILAFRSMAKTLVHDLEGAMRSVVAQ